ncbi:hypothetical protein JOC78_002123 [Bacillus ectoiniformans]|uniref:hypothetical protein n=1 Tax=Bacillus ectoiniformans TaxID=1494429 RepID=UPI0019588BE1|nr:hypothetical protein [Bacillus ectoiniformans]MBM7649170.1 hypothetical protein [Bacillus ectoiniformans]
MNTSGMLRGYLSKVMDPESYFYHVVTCMEKQLTDWEYDPILLFDWQEDSRMIHMSFIINGELYWLELEKELSKQLQLKSPYSIDRYLWEILKKQGLKLKESNYILNAFL